MPITMRYPRIMALGDNGLTLEFGSRIDPRLNHRVLNFAASVQAAAIPAVLDIVPAYCSATVYVDPLSTDMRSLADRLLALAQQRADYPVSPSKTISIPVWYGAEAGPDLEDVAAQARLPVEQVIALHLSKLYRVYMIGFTPGFPYLGTLPNRIAVPRLPTPRKTVAAGSVGIAGRQTGIYPHAGPGGWRIIGRTPIQVCHLSRPKPFLLEPGDHVQCVRIDRDEFERLSVLNL